MSVPCTAAKPARNPGAPRRRGQRQNLGSFPQDSAKSTFAAAARQRGPGRNLKENQGFAPLACRMFRLGEVDKKKVSRAITASVSIRKSGRWDAGQTVAVACDAAAL